MFDLDTKEIKYLDWFPSEKSLMVIFDYTWSLICFS